MARVKGDIFELKALVFLEQNDFKLIKQNFSSRFGEIDLIMQDTAKQELVFVEVKMRSYKKFGGAISTISLSKQTKITKTAYLFLQEFPEFSKFSCRFDIICFENEQIKHLENAFYATELEF